MFMCTSAYVCVHVPIGGVIDFAPLFIDYVCIYPEALYKIFSKTWGFIVFM